MNAGDRAGVVRGFTSMRMLAGAAVLLVAGFIVSAYQDRVFRAQQIREMTVQAEILAASVTAAVVFGDARVVQEHVSALKINPEVDAVAVYDGEQNLIASFARAGREAMPRSARAYSSLIRDGKAVVSVPVLEGADTIGSVYIRTIDEPLERRMTRHLAIMLLAVMAALLVGFMGMTERALRRANRQLETRAEALAEANERLQREMEERSKAEDALRQSQKMEAVGQLSGGVAHDFNNLLTIIQGNLHLLKTSVEDTAAVQGHADAASQAAERASQLVRRLLAFSRRQPLLPRTVDLDQLITGMNDLFVHSVGSRVRIELRLETTWKVLCDINQMENVILNLAINARDAMPEGGELAIETKNLHLSDGASRGGVAPGDYVELRVCDSGNGMTEEVRKRAVDPFFTTKPQGEGTGLGLSMAFAFIRQSNGHLTIETAPGEGTKIIILLPRHCRTESAVTA